MTRIYERVKWFLVASGVVSAAVVIFALWALEQVYVSIPICPPTRRQLEEEDLDANPLYRAVPKLRGMFAFRHLGDFPTPVHRFTARFEDNEMKFWVKREDLSSPLYGGNKVRTLQYMLASCEALLEEHRTLTEKGTHFYILGTGGSNQVVATKVHAAALGLPKECFHSFAFIDEREMDNTMNYLSSLSFPGQTLFNTGGWILLSAIIRRAREGARLPGIMMPGGNNAVGVLGQLTAAMELAEQIKHCEVPDPDAIVVALGSMCTVTGLVLGVALARELGFPAFRKPGFRIHAQPVNPIVMQGLRLVKLHQSLTFPFSVGRGVKEIAAAMTACGGPNTFDAAVRVMQEELVISYDTAIVGKYGAHSRASQDAKTFYDAFVCPPPGEKDLWLCGHFTAKSFALLLRLLKQVQRVGHEKHFLFWHTKSFVQPLGPQDEWAAFQAQCGVSSALRQWAVVGGITGHPDSIGKHSTEPESHVKGPEQYRSLMTQLRSVF